MSRFIVKTHTLSDGLPRWQRGVVLAWGNATALVMAERRRNPRVEVYLKGGSEAERLALAGMVRANMEMIHNDLPEGLRGREELDLSLPGEQWTEVAELRDFEREKKALMIRARGGIVEVPPTQELNRLEPESARREDAPKLRVFVSYSHDDYRDCDQMKLRLARLANEGLVSYWHDGQIRAGEEWDRIIRRELADADVVVLLLSAGFFASGYITGVEMVSARSRQQKGEADILPVLLEDCEDFKKHAWLGQLQTVPSVSGRLRPVRRITPKELAWESVENELRRMIADLAKSKRRR
jgi:internalin A